MREFTVTLHGGHRADTTTSYRAGMSKTTCAPARIAELRAILAAYRQLTIEEAESGNWGDVQIEVEGELWRLEQDLLARKAARTLAA